MHFSWSVILAVVSNTGLTSANLSTTSAKPLSARTDNDACASVSSASAAFASATPGSHPRIPAEIAYRCLRSVPLDEQAAVNLTRSLKPLIQLQSTIDYLRFPPDGYLYDSIDIPRLLDAIETKILSSSPYHSEYDFQIDLQSTLMKARDGHFAFIGDLVSVFTWFRPDVRLISVSNDGTLPSVYVADDLLNIDSGGITKKSNPSASPVKSVNNLDVETFLLAESNSDSAQDPDNTWNNRFFSAATAMQTGIFGYFTIPAFYPGPTTEIVFENNTKLIVDNVAITTDKFDGISTGKDMYQAFCTNSTTSSSSRNRMTKRSIFSRNDDSTTISSLPYYPIPEVVDTAELVLGYFLQNSDVAVLAVYGFESSRVQFDNAFMENFQNAVEKFLALAVQEGKKKLVIDLQGNGGGSIDLATDLFAQLFPDDPPNTSNNLRASRGMRSIIVAASNADQRADGESEAQNVYTDFTVVPFAFQGEISPDGKDFSSLHSFYGPNHIGHGTFTAFFQGNYSNDEPAQFGFGSIVITGTGNRTTGFQQPFAAEDVILLTDGTCASACTIFTELMKRKGVQIITMGGRPQTGPMQAVGGVKGSQVFGAENLDTMIQLYEKSTLNTELDAAKGTMFEQFNTLPLNRSSYVSVNGKNQFRIGDDTQTPLQFVYEAADCRIWYTIDMLASPQAIWSTVATLAFEKRNKSGEIDPNLCIAESTGHPSSISGGLQQGQIGPQTTPSNARSKVTGLLVNGTAIIDGLASDEIDANSPVDPSVLSPDEGGLDPDVQEAVQNMATICKGYSGDEWFVKIVCGAIMTKSGFSS